MALSIKMNENSKILKGMYFIYYAIVFHLLWMLCSLPIITMGAATRALFTMVDKTLHDEVESEFKEFFQSFIRGFKESTIVGLTLLLLFAIVGFNVLISSKMNGLLGTITLLIQIPIFVQVFMTAMNVFFIMAKYSLPPFKAIKNAWILGNRHPFSILMVTVYGTLILYISSYFPGIFIFLGSSLIAGAIVYIFAPILKKYENQ